MKKKNSEYLLDLLQELDDIEEFTAGGREELSGNVMAQKAVVRSYEVIGEVCKRLPAELREANPQIDWRQLITFRDFLAHNYEFVLLRYVWEAVEDAPRLRAAIQSMLDSPPTDADELAP